MANGMDVSVKDLRTPAFEETFLNNVDDFLKNPNMLNEQGRAALWLASQVYEGIISDEDFNRMSDEILQSPVNQGTPYDKQVSAWISGLNGENIYRNEQEQSSEEEASAAQPEEESVTETSSEGTAKETEEQASYESSNTSNPATDFTDENFVDSYYGELYKNVDKESFLQYLKDTKNADITEEEAFEVFCGMTRLEQEMCPYTKSDLSEVPTHEVEFSDLAVGESMEWLGGTVTRLDEKTLHLDHEYLGNFDLDEGEDALGYKILTEADGSVSYLPQYLMAAEDNGQYDENGHFLFMPTTATYTHSLPDGLKVADYCGANNSNLVYMWDWPSSNADPPLQSVHCMYANCENLQYGCISGYGLGTHEGNFGATAMSVEYPGSDCYFGFPGEIEDLSGFAQNCPNLDIQVGDAPEAVKNIRGAFAFCNKIGEHKGPGGIFSCLGWDSKSLNYGAELTPLLSVVYAQDVNKGNYHENVKEEDAENVAAGSYVDGTVPESEDAPKPTEKELAEKDSDGDGKITPLDELDKDEVDEAKLHAEASKAKDVDDGVVQSNAFIMSGGARHDNYYWDNAKKQLALDESGYMVSDDNKDSLWQHVVVDGVTGVGLYGITSMVTNSKILGVIAGVGGTYFLDKFTNYPESFAPILRFAKGFCKEGSDMYNKLDEWEQKFAGSEIKAQEERMTDVNVASRQIESGRMLSSISGTQGSFYMKSFTTSLEANAEHCGKNEMFAALAGYWGEDSKPMDDCRKLVADSCAVMEAEYKDVLPENLTEEDKEKLRAFYMRMADGLEAYNNGGMKGIDEKCEAGSSYYALSVEGLGIMNRAYAEPFMDSMTAMNEKYDFLTEEDKQRLMMLDITGCGDLSNYLKENFEALKTDSEMNCENLVSSVLAEEDWKANAFDPYHYDDVIKGKITEEEYEAQQTQDVHRNAEAAQSYMSGNLTPISEASASDTQPVDDASVSSSDKPSTTSKARDLPADGKFAEDINDFDDSLDVEKY